MHRNGSMSKEYVYTASWPWTGLIRPTVVNLNYERWPADAFDVPPTARTVNPIIRRSICYLLDIPVDLDVTSSFKPKRSHHKVTQTNVWNTTTVWTGFYNYTRMDVVKLRNTAVGSRELLRF